MTTQQQAELLNRLVKVGWELTEKVELLEWWADEVWLMYSCWSPQTARFHLTFLVDPQLDLHRHRQQGEGVWAVKASKVLPTRWQNLDQETTFAFGHGWKERWPSFVSSLDCFRT